MLLNYRSVSSVPFYIPGTAVRHTCLLETIVATCDGTTLRTYTLSYGQKQGRHYLTSVTESTPTQSKRPTTFIWDNSDAHGVAERRSTDAAFKNKTVYTGDFNGDGRTDLMDSKTCSNGTSVEYRYDYGRVVGETHRMGGKAFTTSTAHNAATDATVWEATEYDEYGNAAGKLVAIHQTDDRGERMRYVHLDHLGSVWAMTGDDGAVIAEYNYDPWGRRRNPETWDYYDSYEQQGAAMERGFGGHEQLDILDMVNMGGRMYDPYMGRFLTPDPLVQAPDNTQSLNRYAYCLNTPPCR